MEDLYSVHNVEFVMMRQQVTARIVGENRMLFRKDGYVKCFVQNVETTWLIWQCFVVNADMN